MVNPGERFFADLPELVDFEEVISTRRHVQAPDDWSVVITDVVGSTQAILSGHYKDVNALGVACIIALRNALSDVELPYVFGGDGATVLVPLARIFEVETALRGVRQVARDAFSLDLRVAHVPVERLTQAGHPVLVGRYRLSEHIVLAAFSGAGLSIAEEWIKEPETGPGFSISEEGPSEANMEGFECRWQPAESRRGQMVSLLVVGLDKDPAEREELYRSLLRKVKALVSEGEPHPLSEGQMKLQPLSGDFSVEARLVSRRPQGPETRKAQAKARRQALAGRALMKLKVSAGGFNGATYMQEFLQNTDFRKFDGALRMVVDLGEAEVESLRQFLETHYTEGRLAYGMHLSGAALITCMVKSYGGDHIHFVDGADGGYALAAKQLKSQLRAHLC